MNDKTKEKLAARSAYAILALLLVAALTVTVIAIVTTVNKRNEELPNDNGDSSTEQPNPEPPATDEGNSTPDGQEPDENTPPENGNNQPETPNPPEAQVFTAPSSGGYVSKDFTEDVLVFSTTMNDYRVHMGVDIAGEAGAPVYAFCQGTVKEIKSDPFMGKTVVLSHANGIESRYMNLADQLPEGITVGSTVSMGTVIGAIGETAISECADTPHLHFEVLVNGKHVAPSGYVSFPTDTPTSGEPEDE